MTEASMTGGTRHVVSAEAADAGERLDRLIAARVPALSRSRVKALIQEGRVVAAGDGGATITDPSHRVKPGQSFAIIVPEPRPSVPQAQELALDVIYEDDDLIVVNKPAGMVVHPAPGNPDTTLVNALLAHCGGTLSGIGGVRRPGIVHRLDKDTSGLMVAAKNDLAHASLSRQFADRGIERLYRAVVWGVPARAAGQIEGAIGRDPRNRKRMAVVSRGGKPALTRYRVIRRLGQGVASLVECKLATGRTHQIRVHLAALGHPVVGDPVYGGRHGRRRTGEAAAEAAAVLGRQALHAAVLGFSHPRTGTICKFESGVPNDINKLISSLEISEDKL
jgi:23S rRNA pseudouridine1911/1915/1917 synthase